jgi:RNA polymerase sigma-70 factor (ECF subfamily)
MSLADDYDGEVEQLYQKFASMVFHYLINLGTERDLALEFTDDAFLVTRRRWSEVRGYDRPESYAYKVATNLRKRHFRSSRAGLIIPYANMSDLQPDTVVENDLDAEAAGRLDVRAALRSLSEREQQVVELRYMRDFSIADTANILGLRPGTVSRYAHNALDKLSQLLGEPGHQGEES